MKASELAAYFSKKIATAIPYDIKMSLYRYFYEVEPIGVSDGMLSASVRYTMARMTVGDVIKPRYCGDVDIPLRDGDTLQSVLEMAIASTEFANIEEGMVPRRESGMPWIIECPLPKLIFEARDRLRERLESPTPKP